MRKSRLAPVGVAAAVLVPLLAICLWGPLESAALWVTPGIAGYWRTPLANIQRQLRALLSVPDALAGASTRIARAGAEVLRRDAPRTDRRSLAAREPGTRVRRRASDARGVNAPAEAYGSRAERASRDLDGIDVPMPSRRAAALPPTSTLDAESERALAFATVRDPKASFGRIDAGDHPPKARSGSRTIVSVAAEGSQLAAPMSVPSIPAAFAPRARARSSARASTALNAPALSGRARAALRHQDDELDDQRAKELSEERKAKKLADGSKFEALRARMEQRKNGRKPGDPENKDKPEDDEAAPGLGKSARVPLTERDVRLSRADVASERDRLGPADRSVPDSVETPRTDRAPRAMTQSDRRSHSPTGVTRAIPAVVAPVAATPKPAGAAKPEAPVADRPRTDDDNRATNIAPQQSQE
ncbi:MAG: hypothetical protein HY059_22250 [Proteobacteria bacterium]|nr:hypothetical protein [Pseudomonadota bacterium]